MVSLPFHWTMNPPWIDWSWSKEMHSLGDVKTKTCLLSAALVSHGTFVKVPNWQPVHFGGTTVWRICGISPFSVRQQSLSKVRWPRQYCHHINLALMFLASRAVPSVKGRGQKLIQSAPWQIGGGANCCCCCFCCCYYSHSEMLLIFSLKLWCFL